MAGLSECHIPNAKGVMLSKDGESGFAYLVTADRGKNMSSEIFRPRTAEVGMYPSTPSHLAAFPDRTASLASSVVETSLNVCGVDLRNQSTARVTSHV